MSEQTKKILVILVAIVAVGLAIWSGVNAFGPRERVVGDLGDLSQSKGKAGEDIPAPGGGSAVPPPEGKEGELQGGSSASGAPPGMDGR
ncbi:MAG: hypothetical protein RMJ43_10110 [Chloroherpetonaceae bacterium]|nr:hypothetical protein [Chthonomonadaceae bacterium]MDW8208181.1 hypothetical protein [Chloroherpetonaceae bacterium]